ncbi:hypothetical protein LSTR_LSTR004934 [Laodelphax striatellus]|uniref:PAS domain-containing protein n=1 Tax=Laodelphax striatellus TaxID=195883 RepID=A0A482XM76_LAOST|nr:hypothetical protein LSTR_LSTR004934 [Laodelphax striatellus]
MHEISEFRGGEQPGDIMPHNLLFGRLCRLSGFSRAEVMQRPATCDFLHGPLTSQQAVTVVRDALAAGIEKHFEILYYRKDVSNRTLFSPLAEEANGKVRVIGRLEDQQPQSGTG